MGDSKSAMLAGAMLFTLCSLLLTPCSAVDAQQAGFIFLEMQNASQIPAIAEPWLLAFNAAIEIHPVMVPEDLARAAGAIEEAVKNMDNIAERWCSQQMTAVGKILVLIYLASGGSGV